MEPGCRRFGPKGIQTCGEENRIKMTLDEFETIRLIDLQGMTQEECACQMNIARTTVQSIYGTARQKVAECLVNSKEIIIEGGDVVVCNGKDQQCSCSRLCPCREE